VLRRLRRRVARYPVSYTCWRHPPFPRSWREPLGRVRCVQTAQPGVTIAFYHRCRVRDMVGSHPFRAGTVWWYVTERRIGIVSDGPASAYNWIPCDFFGRLVHRRRPALILAALVVFFCLCLADASDGTTRSVESSESAECQALSGQLESSIANPCPKLSATARAKSSEPCCTPLSTCAANGRHSICAPRVCCIRFSCVLAE
jgi:hypothetical protein